MASQREIFIWAVGQQESGGNYRAVNGSSGALGRWQIEPANLPGWARQCRMPMVTPRYFLDHPPYQNRMVDCILGGYYDHYGARGAAAMWYSGQPDWHATYGNPPVYQYVNSVIAIMEHGGARPIPGIGGTGPSAGQAPVPTRQDDWSAHIKRSANQFNHSARNLNRHANRLRSILKR